MKTALKAVEMRRTLGALIIYGLLASTCGKQVAFAALAGRMDLGPRQPAAATTVVVVLAHRNQAQLDTLLNEIASGRAKPISHSEFTRRYAPAAQSVRRVAAFLQARGFQIVHTGASMILAVAATRVVERTFATSVHNVREASSGDWYESTSRPIAPPTLAPLLRTVVISSLPMHAVK